MKPNRLVTKRLLCYERLPRKDCTLTDKYLAYAVVMMSGYLIVGPSDNTLDSQRLAECTPESTLDATARLLETILCQTGFNGTSFCHSLKIG